MHFCTYNNALFCGMRNECYSLLANLVGISVSSVNPPRPKSDNININFLPTFSICNQKKRL